jgi:coenzyme F420-reducing hydrogenase alpha subunit
MSIIRQKLGASITNSAKSAARSSNELTNNWLRRLNDTSTTGEAKDAHSQLQAVLDFYNKQTTGITKKIDWEDYRERIHTPNVVDKIKAKYDKFLESQYTVDSAVNKCGTTTEKM